MDADQAAADRGFWHAFSLELLILRWPGPAGNLRPVGERAEERVHGLK